MPPKLSPIAQAAREVSEARGRVDAARDALRQAAQGYRQAAKLFASGNATMRARAAEVDAENAESALLELAKI